ncbi:MAG TPA: UbiA family prenyltransferase [Alphaproteobacteria bacterium]
MGAATAPHLNTSVFALALRLGRVSNLPTVWTNTLAGIVLAGGAAEPGFALALLAAVSLYYVAGMYLNDAFDRDIDARERPERPIPAGLVAAATVFAAGFGMLAAGFGLLVALCYVDADGSTWGAGVAGLALAAVIVLYDWHHKGNPLSPVLMGLCRVLVYLVAGFATIAAPAPALYLGAVLLLCYLVGLTYAAKFETRARLDRLWPLAFLAAPFIYGAGALADAVSGILYVIFFAWVAYALSFLIIPTRINVPRAIGYLIAGISLLDAMLIATQGQAALAALAVAGFALTLLLQRYVPGT